MKVKELIERLSAMDQDAEVVFEGTEDSLPTSIEGLEYKTAVDYHYYQGGFSVPKYKATWGNVVFLIHWPVD